MNFVGAEKKSDFCGRRLSSIRTVHGILLNVLPKILANSAWRRLCGIGGSHDFTIFHDSAFTLQHRNKNGARRHVRAKALEERPFLVHGVKGPRSFRGEPDKFAGDDLEPRGLKTFQNLANQVSPHRIGLDNRQRSFDSHAFPKASSMVRPINAGEGAIWIPAYVIAAIFSLAVPLPPEMIAPA